MVERVNESLVLMLLVILPLNNKSLLSQAFVV